MRYRGALIGLSLFMVVAVTLTWLVYVTLRRDVAGQTVPYAAVFSDVFGLREGDDVRMAGVRVGRVEKIELQGDLAKVSFVVQSDQQLLGNHRRLGDLPEHRRSAIPGLSLGNIGEPRPLKAGSVIPIERTDPSFDVGTMLNGFEPLFSVLNPRDADNLTKGVIQSLQGDRRLDRRSGRPDVAAHRILRRQGRGTRRGHHRSERGRRQPGPAQRQPRRDHQPDPRRRVHLRCAPPRAGVVDGVDLPCGAPLSTIADEVHPALNELVLREPGFAEHMAGIEPQLAFTGANLPLLLKGFARITNEGAYANAYACDLNATGFFPGLNDVVPIIVDAATPGNKAWYTPRCRNMGNG